MASIAGLIIRRLNERDLDALGRIQSAATGASCWPPRDYLAYDTLVAEAGAEVIGFLVCRSLGPGGREILNLAVDPVWQRRGVGKELIAKELAESPGTLWLEVRAGNRKAIEFYESLGFREISRRREYYSDPLEDAIVMSFSS